MQCDANDDTCWNGYKLIGDNLDKDVKPRYTRIDRQTQSLHFFYYYAVKDHINLSTISDEPNPYLDLPVCNLPLKHILPTTLDHQALAQNMGIILSRILVDELPYFATTFHDVVTRHIDHLYFQGNGHQVSYGL